MQQLSLFLKETRQKPKQARANVLSTSVKLTRDRLARLDYSMKCPLSLVGNTTFCHNCVLFDGREIDLSTPTPQVTMRCKGEQ